MSLPPAFDNTRVARQAAAHSVENRLVLQVCGNCTRVQYPYREVCEHCLADQLAWQTVDGSGEIVSSVQVHASTHAFFRERAPWHVCSVRLAAGPTVIAHLQPPNITASTARMPRAGETVEVIQVMVGPQACALVAHARGDEGE